MDEFVLNPGRAAQIKARPEAPVSTHFLITMSWLACFAVFAPGLVIVASRRTMHLTRILP